MTLVLGFDRAAPPASSIRAVVDAIAPDVPIDGITTVDALMSATLAESRFLTALLTSFAAIALALAAAGTWATASYVASRRLRELGVRAALGAGRVTLVRLIVSASATAAIAGIAAGLGLSIALSRFIEAYVFGVSATDPGTLAVACAVTAGAALAAAVAPALRAVRIRPIDVLRPQ